MGSSRAAGQHEQQADATELAQHRGLDAACHRCREQAASSSARTQHAAREAKARVRDGRRRRGLASRDRPMRKDARCAASAAAETPMGL